MSNPSIAASQSIPEIWIVVDNFFSSIGFVIRNFEVHGQGSNGEDNGTIASKESKCQCLGTELGKMA